MKFKIWLFFHGLYCRFWNWRLPKDLDVLLEEWRKIDHRRDRSMSGKDFRLWLYIKQVNKHRFKDEEIGR